MSELFFYKKPVALNKELHLKSKFVPVTDDYSFSKDTNSVFLTGAEFGVASNEFSIVFSQATNGSIVPAVLLGLRNNENLYLDGKKWRAKYVPAFIRRYPFVLAEGGEDSEKMTVCVDSTYAGFDSKDGDQLFTSKGNYSAYLKNVISFLQEFRGQFKLTQDFVARLQELDLFSEYSANIEMKSGEKFSLGSLLIVNEKKFLKLKDDVVLELFRSGQLAWIYFHLVSLSNMGNLVDLAANET